MEFTSQREGVDLRAGARRLLLRDHPWGRFEMQVMDRSATVLRYVLVVYPPGTSEDERMLMAFTRAWPSTGALAGITAFMVLADVVHPDVLVPVVLTVYALGVAVGLAATRRLRRAVRRATVTVLREAREDNERYQTINRIGEQLERLDRRPTRGGVDPVRYQFEWGRAYAALHPDELNP